MRTGSTTPSCAHRQPWRLVAIEDPALIAELPVSAVGSGPMPGFPWTLVS